MDFYTDNRARSFENKIDLVLVVIAKVAHEQSLVLLRSHLRELRKHEALEQGAEALAVTGCASGLPRSGFADAGRGADRTARRTNRPANQRQTYWYDRYRIGPDIHQSYIGEETPELLARLEQFETLKAERTSRRQERSRIVRLLRNERFLGMDGATGSLMSAISRTVVFRLGGTLVGTTAFRLYEGELGLRLALDQTAMTNDIHIANIERLSLALGDSVSPPLQEVFDAFAFAPIPSLDRNRIWRWRQVSTETMIEFLTPHSRRTKACATCRPSASVPSRSTS